MTEFRSNLVTLMMQVKVIYPIFYSLGTPSRVTEKGRYRKDLILVYFREKMFFPSPSDHNFMGISWKAPYMEHFEMLPLAISTRLHLKHD